LNPPSRTLVLKYRRFRKEEKSTAVVRTVKKKAGESGREEGDLDNHLLYGSFGRNLRGTKRPTWRKKKGRLG